MSDRWRTILAAIAGLSFGELCGIGFYLMAKSADRGVYNWYSGDWLGDLSWCRAVFGSFLFIPLAIMIPFVMAAKRYKRG
jgi:hypothetical protein